MRFFIRTINSTYAARDTGADYDTAHDALTVGIRGAVALAADEVTSEQRSSAVEVRVEREDGSVVLRSIVSTAVAVLLPLEHGLPVQELVMPAND